MGWIVKGGLGLVVVVGVVLGLALVAESLARRRDAALYPPPGRMIAVDGRRLHIRCLGQGAPTVVLEAGGGNPAMLAFPVQDRVARVTRVCAYDRAGLGWSDPAPDGRTFEDRARELHALLAAAGEHGPYVLAGESLGGLVARTFTRLYPDEVAGVVLVDAAEEQFFFGKLDKFRAQSGQWKAYALAARLGLTRWLIVHQPERAGLPAGMPLDERRRFAALFSRPAYLAALPQEVEAYELAPPEQRRAGGFGGLGNRPLAVISHGRPFTGPQAWMEDGWAAGQARLATLSTDSETLIATRSGHAIAQTEPDLVAQTIARVVAKVRARGTPP
ncbi:alpha/beta fold hydrolase [Phenylobacterium sp.]|uniref:alpha/beta fold hydrolase n=1 Tax=Phenylobacterium sp. TaxID=1871053 RepID=UPI003BAA6B75